MPVPEPGTIPADVGNVGDVFEIFGVPLRIRESEPTDRAYIATRWITSADLEDKRLHGLAVDRLLDSPRSRIVVVCSERVPSTIFAWAVALRDPCAIHYAYVDAKMRGFGVGRAVIRAVGYNGATIACTHPWPFESERYLYDATRAGCLLALGG